MSTLLNESTNIATNQQAIKVLENDQVKVEHNLTGLTNTHIMYVMTHLRAEHALNEFLNVQEHVSILMTYAGFRINKNEGNPYGNTKIDQKVYTNVSAFKDFELDFVDPDKKYDTRIEKVNKQIIKAYKCGVNILDLLAVTTEYGIAKLIKEQKPKKAEENSDESTQENSDESTAETITLSSKFTCLDVLTVIQKRLTPDMQDKLNRDILMVIQSYNNELKSVA